MARERGIVKWFNNAKGYGFIGTKIGKKDKDIFVHYSAINCEGYKTLHEGDVVEFDVEQADKGIQAAAVTVIEYANATQEKVSE